MTFEESSREALKEGMEIIVSAFKQLREAWRLSARAAKPGTANADAAGDPLKPLTDGVYNYCRRCAKRSATHNGLCADCEHGPRERDELLEALKSVVIQLASYEEEAQARGGDKSPSQFMIEKRALIAKIEKS